MEGILGVFGFFALSLVPAPMAAPPPRCSAIAYVRVGSAFELARGAAPRTIFWGSCTYGDDTDLWWHMSIVRRPPLHVGWHRGLLR
jgi:hypothetical protein